MAETHRERPQQRRPRLYEQGASKVVIGTDDAHEACKVAGITPTTHAWTGTEFGPFARRRGGWVAVSSDHPPKDARLGVKFVGPIRIRSLAEPQP